jgi:type I restriction enzyme S subunit
VTWTTRTLGAISDEVGGVIRTGPFGSQLHESDYVDQGVPVVMPKDIVDGRISDAGVARISVEDAERLGQHRLRAGDIVYGRRGDIGRRAYVSAREAGWLCGTGCLRISLGDSMLDPRFLYYYLGHPDVVAAIGSQAIGATMPNLNTTILRNVQVRYPELPTQRTIAGILSAYDDLMVNNARRIAILEEMARALYREWFVEFRFPGHEQVAMVESEVGQIPDDWTQVEVADVAQVNRGRSYRGADIVETGGLPFLNLKCVGRDGGFRPDGLKRYAGPFRESQEAKPGDIVMAVTDMTQERRIVARAARVPSIGEARFVFSMDLVKIVPADKIPPEYLYSMFRYSSFPDQVKQHANGANVLHLSPERIEKFRFPLATLPLRTQFAEVCCDLFRQTDVLGRANDKLRQARDVLLPKLVFGEIHVSGREAGARDVGA